MNVSFFVPGIPAPGGSKRGFAFRRKNGTTGVSITEDCKRSSPWRAVVQHAAATAARETGTALLPGVPLVLGVTFYMPRPKSHFGKHGVKATAPAYPATKPDATKLLRPLEDACKGILWVDDAQIVDQHARKFYAGQYTPVGASVVVFPATYDANAKASVDRVLNGDGVLA